MNDEDPKTRDNFADSHMSNKDFRRMIYIFALFTGLFLIGLIVVINLDLL
jgi:hypothetical protein